MVVEQRQWEIRQRGIEGRKMARGRDKSVRESVRHAVVSIANFLAQFSYSCGKITRG